MEKFKKWFGKRCFVTKKGAVKDIDKNVFVTPPEILKIYKNMLSTLDEECNISLDDVNKVISQSTQTETQTEKKPPKAFILELLSTVFKDTWHISKTGLMIEHCQGDASLPADFEDLRVGIMSYIYNNSEAPKYLADEIRCSLKDILSEWSMQELEKIVKKLRYNPKIAEDGICERFMSYLFRVYLRPEGMSYPLFVAVMKHWMWLVKRKLWNRKATWHIMVHWYGAQGLGKTETIKKLLSPLDGFWSTATLTELLDSTREIKRLSNNFVINLDELAVKTEDAAMEGGHLKKAQIDLLKMLLTAEEIDARILGGQEQSKRRATFSVIATANSHLYDVVFDPTSMRRYVEIPCTGKRPESWEHHEKYMSAMPAIWQSINEDLENGYLNPSVPEWEELQSIQNKYYPTNTTTRMWMDRYNVRTGTGDIMDAYDAYREWCKSSGNMSKALQNFIADVKHFLPDAVDAHDVLHIDYDN